MTDPTPGGWPDAARPGVPQNPERDGVHALRVMLDGELVEVLEKWSGAGQCWVHPEMRISPEAMAATVHSYLGPCHTPAEVAAQVEAARREEREENAELAERIISPWSIAASDELAAAIRARGDA